MLVMNQPGLARSITVSAGGLRFLVLFPKLLQQHREGRPSKEKNVLSHGLLDEFELPVSVVRHLVAQLVGHVRPVRRMAGPLVEFHVQGGQGEIGCHRVHDFLDVQPFLFPAMISVFDQIPQRLRHEPVEIILVPGGVGLGPGGLLDSQQPPGIVFFLLSDVRFGQAGRPRLSEGLLEIGKGLSGPFLELLHRYAHRESRLPYVR